MNRLIFLLCIGSLFAQDAEKWKYTDHPILKWEDFQGKADSTSTYAALTASGIAYSWEYDISQNFPDLSFDTFAYFYPQESWKTERVNNQILDHEQLHWDITYLHSLYLYQSFKAYIPGRMIRRDLKRIFDQINKSLNEMQRRYDKETDHGKVISQQRKWKNMIQDTIKEVTQDLQKVDEE